MSHSLQKLHTFGFQASAAQVLHCKNNVELLQSLDKSTKSKQLILGGGSNIIFGGHADLTIIKNEIKDIQILDQDAHHIYIRVGAGVIWADVIQHALQHNYGGIENLTLIPGTMGAAPIQNIGAYGIELRDVFHSLAAVDRRTGVTKEFSKKECRFDYRESIFKQEAKNKYVITDVTLRLTKRDHQIKADYGAIKKTLEQNSITNPTIQDISNAVAQIRMSKLPDPSIIGNAGSFFKNPIISKNKYTALLEKYPNMPSYPISDSQVKVPAGWLIDQAGWKGKAIGGAAVHDKQALVLINKNNADISDLIQLYQSIQLDIQSRYDISLEREVTIYKNGVELIDD